MLDYYWSANMLLMLGGTRPFIASLFTQAKEKASEASSKHVGMGVGFASEASKSQVELFRFALASKSPAILSARSTIE